MSIAKEEIFGQAITGLKFESEEEAVAITNNSPYGLTSYIRNLYQGCGKKQ
jgi:aldehyde dehydrogenase (NAD+)